MPGVQGERGPAGPQGPQGPKGIQGESAEVGVTYIRWGEKPVQILAPRWSMKVKIKLFVFSQRSICIEVMQWNVLFFKIVFT